MRGLFGWKSDGNGKGGAPKASGAKAYANGGDVDLDYTPETITDATLAQISTTPDPRFKEIMTAAVKHMHAFAREVKLTPGEWLKGIDFLTRTGQFCTPDRQEFILLSDTLGLSTLVNVLHDKTAMEEATHSSLLGPFFRENPPKLAAGEQISKRDASDVVILFGKVVDNAGKAIPNARVSVWQTATDGRYDMQHDDHMMDCRGEFTTDANGDYFISSVRPRFYSIPLDGPTGEMIRAQNRQPNRPAHIHFLITAPGYREMVTALYIADDPHIFNDVVFGAHGELIAGIKKDQPGCPVPNANSIKFNFMLAHESAADRQMGRVGADPSKLGATAN